VKKGRDQICQNILGKKKQKKNHYHLEGKRKGKEKKSFRRLSPVVLKEELREGFLSRKKKKGKEEKKPSQARLKKNKKKKKRGAGLLWWGKIRKILLIGNKMFGLSGKGGERGRNRRSAQ